MNRTRLNLSVLVVMVLAVVLGGGGIVGGAAAPFTLPDGVPVAAMVFYDDKPEAIQRMTSAQAQITTDTGEGSARKAIEDRGGEFQLTNKKPSEHASQWVKDAYEKKGGSVPWIVAAGKRGGINQAVPPDVDSRSVVDRLISISGK